MGQKIEKLPKFERLRMIDKRVRSVKAGAGSFTPSQRATEIEGLATMRKKVKAEK